MKGQWWLQRTENQAHSASVQSGDSTHACYTKPSADRIWVQCTSQQEQSYNVAKPPTFTQLPIVIPQIIFQTSEKSLDRNDARQDPAGCGVTLVSFIIL